MADADGAVLCVREAVRLRRGRILPRLRGIQPAGADIPTAGAPEAEGPRPGKSFRPSRKAPADRAAGPEAAKKLPKRRSGEKSGLHAGVEAGLDIALEALDSAGGLVGKAVEEITDWFD